MEKSPNNCEEGEDRSAVFWKAKVAELAAELKETKEEFQEFQDGSRELEAELEAQLEQAEAKIKEYRSLSNRLHMDNDELKAKLEQSHKEYAFQVGEKSHIHVYIICYSFYMTELQCKKPLLKL